MKYPKILTLFKRDEKFKVKVGDFTIPEFEMINEWEVTEKIHGMNIRVIYEPIVETVRRIHHNMKQIKTVGRRVIFKGRNEESQIPEPMLKHLEETFTLEKLHKAFPDLEKSFETVTIFGEGYGAGINSGGWYRADHGYNLRPFDVYISDQEHPLGGWWLESENVEDICDKLDIVMVPVLGMIGTDTIVSAFLAPESDRRLGSIVQLYEDPEGKERKMEGFICKSKPLLFTRKGERLMFKLKVKDFARD